MGKEIRRGRGIVCAAPWCKREHRKGATIGCWVESCKNSFHYPCAEAEGLIKQEHRRNAPNCFTAEMA